MNNNIRLNTSLRWLPRPLRIFLAAFLLLLSSAVFSGLTYVAHNTRMQPEGISTHYAGGMTDDDGFDIPEHYAKPFAEMLITTHNHLFGFAFIFLTAGLIFYMSSFPWPGLKYFLMTEPFVTVFFTFSGLWLVRYVHPLFSWAVIFFSVLT